MDRRRQQRIDHEITRLVSAWVAREATTAASLITPMRTDFQPENNRATVYVTVLPDDAQERALQFLRRRVSDIREYVGDHLTTKYLPWLDFAIDAGEKNRQRIDALSRQERADENPVDAQ